MRNFTNKTIANTTWLDRDSPLVDHDSRVSDITIGKREDDIKTTLDHVISTTLRFGIPTILLVFLIFSTIVRWQKVKRQRQRLTASKEKLTTFTGQFILNPTNLLIIYMNNISFRQIYRSRLSFIANWSERYTILS